MDFDVTAVEGDFSRRLVTGRNGSENVLPNSPHAPPREPIVDRLVRAIFARTILPPAADLLHMHDAT